MDIKPFVFENVPELDDKAGFLNDYFGSIVDKEVTNITLLSAIPDRTLVTFSDDCLDLDEMNEALQSEPLFDTCLRVAKAVQQNAVLLDRRQFSHFESYLESHVKGGKSVVHNSVLVPESDLVAVGISSPDALESIFSQKEVKVQPFFRNFHGCIRLNGSMLADTIENSAKPAQSSPLGKAPPIPPKPQIKKEPQQPSVKDLAKIFIDPIRKFPGFWRKDVPGTADRSPPSLGGSVTPQREPVHRELQNQICKEEPKDEEENVRSRDTHEDPQKTEEEEDKKEVESEESGEAPQKIEEEDTGEDDDDDTEEDGSEEDDSEEDEVVTEEDTDSDVEEGGGKGKNEAKENTNERKQNQEFQAPLQPGRKSFVLKPRQISRSKSRETEAEGKDKKEHGKPNSEALDLDEHIWNLIEGKLDHSLFCTHKYDKRRQVLKFKSLNVEACQDAIDDLRADIIEGTPLKIPDNLRTMFVDLQKKDFFNSCAEDYFQRFEVQFFIQDISIRFHGWDAEQIEKTKTEVRQRFMHSEEIGNENGMDISHLRQIKKDLESEFMVNISWTDTEASKILIQGVYDDIFFAQQSLEEAMKKYRNRTDCFEFSVEQASYINRYRHYKLETALEKVKVSFQGNRDGKYVIEYSGRWDDINSVAKALEDIKGKITIENSDVSQDFSEMGGLFRKAIINQRPNDPFSTLQNLFENETKCCILYHKPEPSSAKGPKEQPKKRQSPKDKQSISVQMSPSLSVHLKPSGNIVTENADVLVCPLHESKALKKLRISKAFHFADPSLQGKVQQFDLSSSQVHLCKMATGGGTDKDIAFVVLSPWNENTPEDYLHQLVAETLLKASELGAKTVAFPPIGLGIMMKYPPELIAKQYFSGIKDYVDKTKSKAALKMVEILACDRDLLKELQAQSDKFQTLSKTKKTEVAELDEEEPELDSAVPQVTMTIIHGKGDKSMASAWREKFNNCIIDDEYCLNSPCMPQNLDRKLKKELSKLVIVMKKVETESEDLVLKFKGLNEDTLKIRAFIADEIHMHARRTTHIISEHSPPRGTVEFIDYAAGIEEPTPPYWTHKTQKSLGDKVMFKEVDVDKETVEAIKNLFLKTFDASQTGLGNDAKGIPRQSTVEFVGVKRIENITKYRAYQAGRKQIFEKKSAEKEVCKSVSEVSQKLQGCQLEPYLSDEMKDYLCHEINECYLLHGTKPDIVDTIKRNGCDPNVSSTGAMFGKGVYAAECATKCDQYTDDPNNRLPSGSIHYAFLLRMLLGDIFVCNDKHASVQSRDSPKLNRPPCKACQQDKCFCPETYFYDSVLGEGRWIFREFIVYRDYLCYPEYLITYKRI